MRILNKFNEDWFFHAGELKVPFKKNVAKTGTCGGPSNLTIEEGANYPTPKHIAEALGEGMGMFFMNFAQKLEGTWENVAVPHDWRIREDYIVPEDNVAGIAGMNVGMGGYLPEGVAYYRKKFHIPIERLGDRVVIEFEGVMRDATIWVNGSYIGSHYSGYTGFEFDITEYVSYGDEDNIILVKTDATTTEGWWAEGAGIYRNVWLKYLNPIHVKRHGTFIYTEDVDQHSAKVISKVEVNNESNESSDIVVRQSIISGEGKELYKEEKSLELDALDEGKVQIEFKVDNPCLWELDNPYLYTMMTDIILDEKVIDQVKTTFGIRDIEYTQKGLFINGNLTEIKGACEHQDFAGVGIGLTDDIIAYKIKKMKEMGCNAYRSAHHPATKRLLDVCDREGILVLNENRRVEVNPEGIENLEDLIKGSRNHPCIFMWCLENEEFIAVKDTGKRILKTLVQKARKLDPTRLVTIAGQFASEDTDYMSIPDVAGFNYDSGDAKKLMCRYPDKRVMATEDASYCSTRGVYADDPVKGHCSSYEDGNYFNKLQQLGGDSDVSAGTMGGALSIGDLAHAWNHYKHDTPSLGGIFIWTAFDYRGETFPWNWPSINCHYGAMDMCGFEKDAYYYWQSVWTEEPMVHVLPHWNWHGKEGETVLIEAYSNCEAIELFVNQESQGRQVNTLGSILRWDAEYQPGELKIVGYINGNPVVEKTRVTAGQPSGIRVTNIYDGDNEVLVKIEVIDEKGRLCPTADNHIQFEVIGGQVIGVGNGNPSSHESDVTNHRKAFNGLALAIISKSEGDVKVIAKSNGLELGQLTIN